MAGDGVAIARKERRGSGTPRVFNMNKMVSPSEGNIINRMELRSGKKLPPFTPGKPKKYLPCNHRSLDKPPPNKDVLEAMNFQVIEEELPANCRCVAERGITSVKIYHIIYNKGKKFIPGQPTLVLDAPGTMHNAPPFRVPKENVARSAKPVEDTEMEEREF